MSVKAIAALEFVGTKQSFQANMEERYDRLYQSLKTKSYSSPQNVQIAPSNHQPFLWIGVFLREVERFLEGKLTTNPISK